MKNHLIISLLIISVGFSQNRVNVNNLVKYGDKYFKENEDKPFIGLVFDLSKETGNKILEYQMDNGMKNGLYQKWYLNGKSEIKGKFFNDDRTGEWTWWYENGQKKSEKNYRNGKLNGSWISWYENGQKSEEENYFEGTLNGVFRKWYPNGQKELDGNFKDGKGDGKWTWWYEHGQKKSEGTSKDGEPDGLITQWYENGQKMKEGTYKDKKEEGLWTEWYENGRMIYKGTYKDGEKDGFWIHSNKFERFKNYSNEWVEKQCELVVGHIHPKGRFEGHYINGKQTGKWTYWYNDSVKEYEGNYQDGFRIGFWIGWYENGLKYRHNNYSLFEFEEEIYSVDDGLNTTWDEFGNIVEEYMWFKGGDLWSKTYTNGVVTERWFNPHYFNNPSELTKEVFWDPKKYFQNWDGEKPKMK